MKSFESVAELKATLQNYNKEQVGFVPTMGALHAGHISLVAKARAECDVVVVSIFVNPTQFNDKGDLVSYPRTPESDLAMLEEAGVDYVLMPSVDEIYPEEDTRTFDFGVIESVMEGATRPGHFNGVGQVVSRLFDIVNPSKSYFGQKDFQQVAVIRSLVEQLNIDVEIIEVPTFRGDDGLALSSRNALLSAEHRAVAPTIYAALSEAKGLMDSYSPAEVEQMVTEKIDATGLLKVIYLQIVDGINLQRVSDWNKSDKIQMCTAVQAGNVRLIDNINLK
ncbi:MAG: pantoate--beta-alanine ligase [Rikenellaceae bacterium]